jgi:O-antigen ligase
VKRETISRAAEAVSAFLLAAAFAVIQTLIGGTRLLFSLPAYGLLALIGLLALFSLRRAKPEPDQLCLAGSAIFFGYILTRAFFSPVPFVARADIYAVLGGLVVYLFVACILTNAKPRMFILLFLCVLGIIHAFIGALQFRDGTNFMPISFLQRVDYGRRASGLYICPNHLAGLLEVLGVFGLSIVCWSRWRPWAKLLTAYAVAICYTGLILTGSRGGYLSTAASLLIFAILSLVVLRQASAKLFWKIGGSIVLAAAAILIAVVFLVHKSDYLSGRAQNVFETTNMRVDLWRGALQQWKLEPVFGTGSGTYLYYGRQFRTDRVQADPVRVHNDYLQLLAEYGAAGALIFLIFFGLHLRRGWKTFRRLGPMRAAVAPQLSSNALALNLGALAAIGAYVIHSVVDFNLHIPANVLLLAFVFGIIANPGIRREGATETATKSMLPWRLILPALSVLLLIGCARLLPGEYFAERARMAYRDSRPAETIFYALRALDYEKQNPYVYDFLGRGRSSQGSGIRDPRMRSSFERAALEAFWKAREIAPRDEIFAIDLGLAYDALERFTEAEWMYQEALILDPKSKSTQDYYRAHIQRWRSSGGVQPPSNEKKSAPATSGTSG